MGGVFLDQRLGAEGDAQAGGAQHGQVVGAVAHGDHLLQVDAFSGGDLPQQLRLALAVDDRLRHLAGDFAVDDLQGVGVDVVDAQQFLQPVTEPGEAAGQNRGAVAQRFQGGDQPVGAFGELNALAHPFQGAFVQPFKQRHPGAEAFVEIQLAEHRPVGDRRHLLADAGLGGQLVDHLRADQRGIHIEYHQAAVAPESAVALEGDVQVAFVGDRQKGGAHGARITGFAAYRDFHAGAAVRVAVLAFQVHPAGKPGDAVDVKVVIRHHGGHVAELLGGDLARQQGNDVAVLALAGHPLLVAVLVDGPEAHRDIALMRLEQQVLEHRGRFRRRRHFHQDAQRQGVVDHRLADIQNIQVVAGQNAGKGRGEAGPVVAGHLDENNLAHAGGFLGLVGTLRNSR